MKYILLLFVAIIGVGCSTTYSPHRTDTSEIKNEGSVVFVRPGKYTILGSRSIRDYVEIAYETMNENSNGYPTLNIGFRNRGGQHFWDVRGGDVQISVQVKFYKSPLNNNGYASGPAAYTSNWQAVKMVRGETIDYQVNCPVKEAIYYQVTVSEFLK